MSIRKRIPKTANALIFFLFMVGCYRSANPDSSLVYSYLKMLALNFEQVRLGGELGTRYQAATVNLFTHTDRYPPESFAASAAGHPGALWWDWPGPLVPIMSGSFPAMPFACGDW